MARLHQPLLLFASNDPLRVTTRRRHPWDRLVAKWRSLTLDSQLAEGFQADTDRLRLVRAEVLSLPRTRLELAREWEMVMDRSVRPHRGGRVRIPLQYRQIRLAETAIRRLVAGLRSGRAINVQGVAMASLLLTDGTGPLYNPARAGELRGFVNSAVDHLDPMTLLRSA
ncbi:MAG TPA: hypothetical protein VHX15_13850 [Frankiaceae bacterium]|jgi:hypothetical protein|nr:hypothetical protein [Frankiaceae bacterium]